MNPALLVFLGLGAYFYMKKANVANQLQYFPNKATIESGKLFFYLEVLNPTMTPLTINNIFLSFYSGVTFLGRTQVTTPVTITKNGSTILRLPIKVSGAGIVALIGDWIKGTAPTSLKIDGTVTGEGVQVKIQQDVPLV